MNQSMRSLLFLVLGAAIVGLAVWVIRGYNPADPGGPVAEEYVYRDPAGKAEPGTWREVGSWPTGLAESRGMAWHDGIVFVVGDRVLVQFDETGKKLSDWPFDDALPVCVTTDGERWFVADGTHVLEAVPSSKRLRSRAVVTLESPSRITSIAVKGDRLFVADAGRRNVWRYDTAGKRLGTTKGPGFSVPSANFPLLVDRTNLLRVVNTGKFHVEAYTLDGDYEEPLTWGRPGTTLDSFIGCCNPVRLAQLPDGRFVTSEKGTPRVKVWSETGVFETLAVGAGRFDDDRAIAGLACDTAGRIYVLDRKRNAVRVFTAK